MTLTVHSIYFCYYNSVEAILEGKQNILKVEQEIIELCIYYTQSGPLVTKRNQQL